MKQITDDIYLSSRFNPDDYTRVALFYGDTFVDQENKDGTVEFISSKRDYYRHYEYLIWLLHCRFLSDSYLQKSLEKNWHNPLQIFSDFCSYAPNHYGILLFFDVSDLMEDVGQTDGIFMGDHITEKQYQTLKQYQDYFNAFYSLDFEFLNPESSLRGSDTRNYLEKVAKLRRTK